MMTLPSRAQASDKDDTSQPLTDNKEILEIRRSKNNPGGSSGSTARYLREYKLVLVGGGSAGKSSLTIQFILSQFIDDYDLTIEDSHGKQCVIDGEVVLLDILDTAIGEEHSAMREHYMGIGQGFLLVYSITSRQSFEEIETFRQQILRVKDKHYFPMIIVGNHCERESERQVSTNEGKEMVRIAGYPFLEASARSRINVEQVFHGLVREIWKYERRLSPYEEALMAESKSTPSSYNRLRDFFRRQRGAK